MISRSPLSLTRDRRTPESMVALASRARLQFSATALRRFALLGLLLLGLGGRGLLALFFQALSLPVSLGALAAAVFAGAPLAAGRGASAWRPARMAGLPQDVLGRDVGRRRLVAEDLAAVLVEPLPLRAGSEGQGATGEGHGNGEGAGGKHRFSVAA
jgi:hypothetical protein